MGNICNHHHIFPLLNSFIPSSTITYPSPFSFLFSSSSTILLISLLNFLIPSSTILLFSLLHVFIESSSYSATSSSFLLFSLFNVFISFSSTSSSFLSFSLLLLLHLHLHLLHISIVFSRKGQRGQNQAITFEFGLLGLILTSLAFLRKNNKNEEEEEEGIKTLRRENNKNEEEVEEEEDSIKTWRRENNTDLTLGWTVG